MDYKFMQPVSMRVTKDQYERDLREPLLAMGYKEVVIEKWGELPILVTNLGSAPHHLSKTRESLKTEYNRYFIDHYNPELFLAIAAMTDKESPIVGEWLACTEGSSLFGYKIGQVVQNNNPAFKLGYYHRKATLQELIEEFSNQKQDNMNTNFTTEELEKLRTLIAPKNKEEFDKLIGAEKPMFKKEEFITGDKVVLRDGNIYLVIRDCNAGTDKNQIFVLLQCVISGGFMSASSYDSKLCSIPRYSEYDIMKIYRLQEGRLGSLSISNDLTGYALIWSRE